MLIIVDYWESMNIELKEGPYLNRLKKYNLKYSQNKLLKTLCTWKEFALMKKPKGAYKKGKQSMKNNVKKPNIKLNQRKSLSD